MSQLILKWTKLSDRQEDAKTTGGCVFYMFYTPSRSFIRCSAYSVTSDSFSSTTGSIYLL